MTAFNLWAKGKIGLMLTDTAVYTSEGIVVGFQQKAHELPEQRMAVACRGHWQAGGWLAGEIEDTFSNFDAFIAGAGPFLSRFVAENAVDLDFDQTIGLEVGIVGYSDARKAARAFMFSTQDARPIGGAAPLTLVETEAFFFPAPAQAQLVAARVLHPAGHLIQEGEPLLRKVIELQRRQQVDFGKVRVHLVGGGKMLTRVTPHRIETRSIGDWGDEVGELIRPEARQAAA